MCVFHHPSTFLFISLLLISPLLADKDNNNSRHGNGNRNHNHNVVVDNINASNPSAGEEDGPSPTIRPTASSSFKPSIAVIVGVVTSLFSITFLLLLYARHCKRNNGRRFISYSHGSASGSAFARTLSERKNSGISRAVVESLPLFRFSSLTGLKDGLECAVCLTPFEPNELLRLLPKCKHGFHVECLDTWLDAHSTCPLCRYRVHPEDILLVIQLENSSANNNHNHNQDLAAAAAAAAAAAVPVSSSSSPECSRTRRVSGRHSYAAVEMEKATTSFRRSVDSFSGISSGYYRKDGLLLSLRPREDEKKRLEHRIIVSGSGGIVGPPPPNGSGKCLPSPSGFHQRWSDVQPSDLLYLRSEMIISQNCRLGIGSLAETTNSKKNNFGIIYGNGNHKNKGENGNGRESVSETEKSMSIGIDGIGRSIINSRSVSEITGLSRFSSKHKGNSNDNDDDSDGHRHHRQRRQGLVVAEAGLVSRWLPWISSTSHSGLQSQPVVSTFAAYP